jgi:hypothetical protein
MQNIKDNANVKVNDTKEMKKPIALYLFLQFHSQMVFWPRRGVCIESHELHCNQRLSNEK